MPPIKQLLKAVTPEWLLHLRRKLVIASLRRSFGELSRQEAFSRIYSDNFWGRAAAGHWSSGSGSVGRAAEAYKELICRFVEEHGITSVVDLGCGDFRIGASIAKAVHTYIGVDVVPELVGELRSRFGSPTVEFLCLDIVDDNLPLGQLCLVRQVLQHLSNEEIRRIIPKLACYKWVLVTEHYPAPGRPVSPNKDKPHGPDTRVIDDSAVFLDEPPFGLSGIREVLQVETESFQVAPGEVIRTFLIAGSSLANAEMEAAH
ncbi:MAG: class I SAM-dependent methyltransferase [Sulfuricaulis sp.]|uniref:class I SAM-dependent methyltransferase n=1 Tax=Sulfuricaulis sp. TaxID=2003553 RepID=UPI0034A2B54A